METLNHPSFHPEAERPDTSVEALLDDFTNGTPAGDPPYAVQPIFDYLHKHPQEKDNFFHLAYERWADPEKDLAVRTVLGHLQEQLGPSLDVSVK